MTIEERLKALAQSREILNGMQMQNEKRFETITRNFEMVLDSIKALERIATAHDERISDLAQRNSCPFSRT